MTLQEFIKKESASKVGRMIGVTRQAVAIWKDGNQVPKLSLAFRLIVVSQYKLTLDSIYGGYLRKRFKGKSFKSNLNGRQVQLEFKF